MAKETERSKKRKTTRVGQDEQLAFECAVYQVLGKLERDKGSTSKRKGKSAAELKNGLASMKSALAEWRKKGGGESQSAMLAAVLKQYLAEMESDCAKREEPVKPPEQAQGQTAPPQTGSTRLRPGLIALLPDLCLLTVFRQLPLEDQLTTQRVCRRFAVLGQEVMRNRRNLTLLFGRSELHYIRHLLALESNLLLVADDRALLQVVRKADGSLQFPIRPLTKWNSLRYDAPTEATLLELGQTFRGITKLQIGLWQVIDITAAFNYLARLLEQNPQLVIFRLFGFFTNRPDDLVSFNRTLSSLRHLKQLTLRSSNSSLEGLTSSFIAQLDLFSFRDFASQSNFPRLCQELNDQNQHHLPAIYFHCDSSNALSLADLSRLSGPLRRQVKQLHFYDIHFPAATYIDDLGRHCAHFPSLVTLVLRPLPGDRHQPTITWRAILGAIVQLRHLVYLKLDCGTLQLETTPGLRLPQLPSLKALYLIRLYLKSHHHLEAMQLGWTMPNLQALGMELAGYESHCEDCQVEHLFYYIKCHDCGQYFEDRNPVGQVLNCLRQFFRGLKRQCRQLHTIRYNYEDSLGTVEQLLAE